MNIVIISIILSLLILIISNAFGNALQRNLIRNQVIIPELLGFVVLMGVLSIIGYIMLVNNIKTSTFFLVFIFVTVLIALLTIRYFKWHYSKLESFFIFTFIAIMFVLSLNYRLGEQLGDNTYLTNMVSMNNIRTYLNVTNFDNGFYHGIGAVGSNKSYLTWYHFFSFITFYTGKIIANLGIGYIPSSILYVWTGNIIFYVLSAMVALNVFRHLKVNSKWLVASILVLALYWGSIYYNLILAHFGSNFVSLFVISLWMLLTQNKKLNLKIIALVIFNIYALASMGNVGLIVAAYIIFAFVIYEITIKNNDIFFWTPFILFPIFHWVGILNDIVPIRWLVPFGGALILISWIIHYFKPIKMFIFNNIKIILFFTLVFWYGLAYFTSSDYYHLLVDFFNPKGNFDRLQDFFSFNTVNYSLRNIAYYISLISLFLSPKTRKFGWMVSIMMLFFINPIVYPMLYPQLQWLYHRAYISVFNVYIIMVGLWALIDYLQTRISKFKSLLIFGWILLIVPITYHQFTSHFHLVYIPNNDFNTFYKLDNDQIEILERLRQIVEIENYDNAKVISQIYGTTLYIPEVYHMYFNFVNRRNYNPLLEDEAFSQLYRIFYTPVFAGDDGPRFEAPYAQTCTLLIENKVDFIIYDKSLSTFDETSMNWIPIHWYIRGCAEKSFENDRYIMYRFYWK